MFVSPNPQHTILSPRLLFIALLASLCAVPAFARPDYPAIIKQVYGTKAGGTLDKAGCNLCHADAPPKVNFYGADLKAAFSEANTKKLTPAVLQSIEAKDSDSDGADNGSELRGDTLPSVASSKPSGTSPTANPKPNSTAKPLEEPNPFALSSLLTPKHAQHPVLVHFPIALFIIGLLFDVLGTRSKKREMLTVGYYNLAIATLTAPITVITGLLAWQFAYGGVPLQGYLLYHLLLGMTTMVLLFVLWGMRSKLRKQGAENLTGSYLALAGVVFLVITLTGHLGGFLAYGS